MNKILLVLLILATINVYAGDPFKGRWVDLSHDYSDETIYWPTEKDFEKHIIYEGENEKGYYYSAYSYTSAEHGGTHIDAPVHFSKGKKTVDQIPLEQLIGDGIVIDVSHQTKHLRNYQITIDDITTWEKQHGKIAKGSIVLFDTNSARFWPDRIKYMGTDEKGQQAVTKLKFPGIHPDAATFLANQRSIKAVGLDTPSIDYGASTHFESHQILFEKNIFGIENIANIRSLPHTGFKVIALPMKIKGGSGAPLRVVAFIPD